MRQQALVNPAILQWARESMNIDLETASSRAGVDTARLRDWENGSQAPTITQARKLAEIYKRPLAVFFLPKPPNDLGFSVPHDFRRMPEDQLAEPSAEFIAELRRMEYQRSAAIELAEEPANVDFLGALKLSTPVITAAKTVRSLLIDAERVRESWTNEYDALNGWKNAVENHGVLVMHLVRVNVAEVRGVAIAENPFPLIAINGKDSPYARIFSLLHEFVHLLLGASGISNLRIVRRPKSSEQAVEVFCNAVTAEVLVPETSLREHRLISNSSEEPAWSDSTIRTVARYFHVSREVIVRRLFSLHLTDRDFYRAKRRQYAAEAGRDSRPGGPIPMERRILRAIGKRFAHIVVNAYAREAITGSDVAELIGARIKHLPAVESLLLGRNTLTGGHE